MVDMYILSQKSKQQSLGAAAGRYLLLLLEVYRSGSTVRLHSSAQQQPTLMSDMSHMTTSAVHFSY